MFSSLHGKNQITTQSEVTDLADVGHFAGLVFVLHVFEENLLRLKRQLTYLAIG